MRPTLAIRYWLDDHQPAPRSPFATPARIDWATVLVWSVALSGCVALEVLVGLALIRRWS